MSSGKKTSHEGNNIVRRSAASGSATDASRGKPYRPSSDAAITVGRPTIATEDALPAGSRRHIVDPAQLGIQDQSR